MTSCYYDGYGDDCYSSAWDSWARWLVLGLIILFAFLLFFLFSCVSARRRRRMGYNPYRGTGWALYNHGPVTYNQAQPQREDPYATNNAPPAYQPPPATGYYGGRNDVELQQPGPVYGGSRGGDNVYEPPAGAPPPKR